MNLELVTTAGVMLGGVIMGVSTIATRAGNNPQQRVKRYKSNAHQNDGEHRAVLAATNVSAYLVTRIEMIEASQRDNEAQIMELKKQVASLSEDNQKLKTDNTAKDAEIVRLKKKVKRLEEILKRHGITINNAGDLDVEALLDQLENHSEESSDDN